MTNVMMATGNQGMVTNMIINVVTGDQVALTCDTMPGNMPKTYKNFVAIWQNQNQIPWNQDPLQKQDVKNDTQAFSTVFKQLDVTNNSYIIGYSVGDKETNICTTAFIEKDKFDPQKCKTFQTSISPNFIGTNNVFMNFNTPDGYMPKTNGNWIGIWRSSTVTYGVEPIAKAPVSIDGNSGAVGINNVDMKRGATYTVGYFMGGWSDSMSTVPTTLAASCTFTI